MMARETERQSPEQMRKAHRIKGTKWVWLFLTAAIALAGTATAISGQDVSQNGSSESSASTFRSDFSSTDDDTSQVSDEFASRMQRYRNGGQSAYEADIGSYDTFIIGKATVKIPKGYSYITSGDLYVAQDASVSDGFPALEFQFYAGGEDECILLLNYYASTMLKNDEPRMIQPLTQADVNGKTVYGKGYTFTRGSSEYTLFIYTYHVGSTNVMTATVEKGENSDQVNLYAIHFIGSLEIADE